MTVISPPALTFAQRALIQGAVQEDLRNAPDGFAGLDGDGNLSVNGIIPRTGSVSELNALVLAAGEIATTSSREIRLGDGITSGGKTPRGILVSDSAILVVASGNQEANGGALIAAYNEAKTFTPGGFAIGSANRVTVIVGPGFYDFGSVPTWAIDTSGIDVVGMSPIGARLSQGVVSEPKIVVTASDVIMRNLFIAPAFGTAPFMTISPATGGVFEDITFITFLAAPLVPSAAGNYSGLTFRRVRCTGTTLMGNVDGVNASATVLFDDCDGGARSFCGGATAAGAGTFSGTIRNCRMSGTAWNLKSAGVLNGVLTKAPVTRLVAGARFLNCVFDTSSDALQNNSSAVAVKANGCVSAANLLGTSVTNTWTATNLQSAGTGLW